MNEDQLDKKLSQPIVDSNSDINVSNSLYLASFSSFDAS